MTLKVYKFEPTMPFQTSEFRVYTSNNRPAYATAKWSKEACFCFKNNRRLRVNLIDYQSRWEYLTWDIKESYMENTEIAICRIT